MAEKVNAIFDMTAPPPKIMQAPYDTSQPAPRIELANATPNNMPQTNPLAGINASSAAKGLYEDPSPIYQPALDFIAEQRNRVNERYAQNKADITNLFGNLTQVNQDSQQRVRQQFEATVAEQQFQTAQRIAQQQAGAEATMQTAIKAADERGGGPMGNLAASPAQVEAQRGISNVNALAQIWQGRMGSRQEQTQQDLLAGLRSLGQQQVMAEQGLGRNLEDVLLGLSGQQSDILGQRSQAEYGARQDVRRAGYQETLAAQERARQTAAAAAEAAAQPREYAEGITGVFQRIADETGDEQSAIDFSNSISKVMTLGTAPTSLGEALRRWIQQNPSIAPYYQGYAADVLSEIFSQTIPSGAVNVGGSQAVQSPSPMDITNPTF